MSAHPAPRDAIAAIYHLAEVTLQRAEEGEVEATDLELGWLDSIARGDDEPGPALLPTAETAAEEHEHGLGHIRCAADLLWLAVADCDGPTQRKVQAALAKLKPLLGGGR